MKNSKNHESGHFFHAYTRGVRKLPLFHYERDKINCLTSILLFQFGLHYKNHIRISQINPFTDLDVSNKLVRETIQSERLVHLIDFNLLDNHLHLILYSERQKGIALYMKRILTGHANRYNFRYAKTGHVFESTYKTKIITTDSYFDVVTEYVQNNHIDYYDLESKKDINTYPFSSRYDHIYGNRWPQFLGK
jgi:REP element-mobilizing transposase RayT